MLKHTLSTHQRMENTETQPMGGEPLYPKIQLKAAVEQPGTRAARALIVGFLVCTTVALIVIALKRLRIRQKG